MGRFRKKIKLITTTVLLCQYVIIEITPVVDHVISRKITIFRFLFPEITLFMPNNSKNIDRLRSKMVDFDQSFAEFAVNGVKMGYFEQKYYFTIFLSLN